jgi:hypothetical protein
MNPFQLKGTSGTVINQRFGLTDRIVVGSADDCDIRVAGHDVAPHHVEILTRVDSVQIRCPEPGRMVRVNGEAVREASLSSGDEIQIGVCRWLLQAPGLKPQRVLTEVAVRPQRALWPWLLVIAAGGLAAVAWQYGWIESLMALI